ncbi:MAG: M64 family metallopeptidase, partial [Bradymonadaceae bacterium]
LRRLLLSTAIVVACGGVVAGCGSQSTSPYPDLPSGALVVESDGSRLLAPEQRAVSADRAESRDAVLAIFEGRVSDSDERPYSARFVRSIEADLYRDRDPNDRRPRHWVTRAKVVDASGDVLWRDRVNSLFQLLDFLRVSLEKTPSIPFDIQQIYALAKQRYPELLKFGLKIPLDLKGAEQYVLEIPDASGEYYEVGRFDLDKLVEAAAPPDVDTEVRPLHETGPPADRIDLAILGDGYTAEQKKEFLGDARAVTDRLLNTSPFDSHRRFLNIRAVWTPSAESGAGYDCTELLDPDCKRDFRDTVFNYVFAIDALADRFGVDLPQSLHRVAFPTEIAKMYEVAATAHYDEILMLSNTDRRSGFAGMYESVLTAFDNRRRFPDVAVHELGHSFGALGDEYYIEGDPCVDDGGPLPPNISRHASADRLKWRTWTDEETPLPTPRGHRDEIRVGAFERAYNCSDLYRPSFNCRMRDSAHPSFCPVCREQLVRRHYAHVDLLRRGYPRVRRLGPETVRFIAGVRAEGRLTAIDWRLNGEVVGEGPTLELDAGEIGSSGARLTMDVDEFSTFVRQTDRRLEVSSAWRLHLAP